MSATAATTSIRAQAKKPKPVDKSAQQGGRVPADGRDRMDKEIVKAVLASPLIVPWPNLPQHLQNGVMAALPKLVTPAVAEYHVSRDRCHGAEKKARRRSKGAAVDSKAWGSGEKDDEDASATNQPGSSTTAAPAAPAAPIPLRPTQPPVLDHLVLGLNETIKALEKNIDDLKLRLIQIGDKLNGVSLPTRNDLLPTAPRSPSSSPEPELAESSPLGWVIVPLLSVNPQSLVSPIPQYCATYNSLVYQWGQLKKTVKTRLKEDEWGVLGDEREEVRVVALGDVEKDMAKIVGLRRLACMGVKLSHPDVKLLANLLPKSILHPPRHSITLPFPTSTTKRFSTEFSARPGKKAKPTSTLPLPHVHYAPLMIKGITTTVPTNSNERKQIRLAGIRAKRADKKEKKMAQRIEERKAGLAADLKTKSKHPIKGKKAGGKAGKGVKPKARKSSAVKTASKATA